ncbi:MAG TPA: OmpH family outer membrane protein [candidate division Zixibacteria bacterium]|nr:OmpH family outer membrane protein [candidate division Zixibacteria bacterium]
MKSRILIIFAMLLLATFLGARDFKLGYINSERLRSEYPAFLDAQAQFDRDVTVWEEEAVKLEEELIEMQTELEQQALLLSEEKKRERQMLIQQKQREYQRFLSEIFGSGGKAERRNAELTSPLLERINKAIIDIAESQGYDLILDVAGGNVAYIDENLDITERLLEELGK